jgi:hypothetical protein
VPGKVIEPFALQSICIDNVATVTAGKPTAFVLAFLGDEVHGFFNLKPLFFMQYPVAPVCLLNRNSEQGMLTRFNIRALPGC